MVTSLLESGLFEDAVQGARSEIVARFPWDGDASWFGSMLELAVALAEIDRRSMPLAGVEARRHNGMARTSRHRVIDGATRGPERERVDSRGMLVF
jgi:hypothetical protein